MRDIMAHSSAPFVQLCAVMACIVLSSCAPDSQTSDNLEDYYFDHLKFHGGGVVYRFESVSDPSATDELWHFRYDSNYRGNYIHAAMYGPDGVETQRSRELLTNDGAQLRNLVLQYRDDTTSIPVITKVGASDTYAFGPIEDQPSVTYSIEYTDPVTDSVRIILTRNRSVTGRGTYEVLGQEVESVFVSVDDVLETETEGFTTSEWKGTEVYAFHMGLVYYKREINADFVLEYRLAEIIPYEDFLIRYTLDTMQIDGL